MQREWWSNEGLGSAANAEPAVAFGRLIDRQREWWENENLAIDGNPDSGDPLDRLEKLERAWWEREGMAKGQSPKDPAAALAQMDRINRQWWKEQKPTRMPAADPREDPAGKGKPEGADTTVKLIDKENTRAFLQAGGTEESEQAVQLGLKWLAAQQMPEGRWLRNGKSTRPGVNNRGKGNDIASTAFALLPFLAHGQTQRAVDGRVTYAKVVEGGLNFLRSQQKADGDLSGGKTMYVHALATLALCEAFNASSDPLLKEPSQKAIDFIVDAQSSRNGGWRYTPGMAGDLSVTSWCLMALKSGQMAGLSVPTKTLDKATVFLQRVTRGDGGYNYLARSPATVRRRPPS